MTGDDPAQTDESLDALRQEVSAAWRAGRLGSARIMAADYLAADGENPWIWLIQADVLVRLGRCAEARRSARKALGLLEGRRDDLYHAYVVMGDAWSRAGRLDRAASWYTQAVACRPRLSYGYFYLGDVLARQGKLDEAAAVFRKATRLEPSRERAYLALGCVRRSQERYRDAEKCFARALELAPDDAQARRELRDVSGVLELLAGRRGRRRSPQRA